MCFPAHELQIYFHLLSLSFWHTTVTHTQTEVFLQYQYLLKSATAAGHSALLYGYYDLLFCFIDCWPGLNIDNNYTIQINTPPPTPPIPPPNNIYALHVAHCNLQYPFIIHPIVRCFFLLRYIWAASAYPWCTQNKTGIPNSKLVFYLNFNIPLLRLDNYVLNLIQPLGSFFVLSPSLEFWNWTLHRHIFLGPPLILVANKPPPSSIIMTLSMTRTDSPRPFSTDSSLRITKGKSWIDSVTIPLTLRLNRTDPGLMLDDSDISQDDGDPNIWRALNTLSSFRLSLDNEDEQSRLSTDLPRFSVDPGDSGIKDEQEGPLWSIPRPFHKWMKNLHRRARRPNDGISNLRLPPGDSSEEDAIHTRSHRKSSSGSSFGFVAAVKSATVSLASVSVTTRRRRNATRSSVHTRTDHSSRGSFSVHRISEDSTCFEKSSYTDPAVTERLLQRRRILEELIHTEESYIGDIRFLMNVRGPRKPLLSPW